MKHLIRAALAATTATIAPVHVQIPSDCTKPDDIRYPSVELALQFSQETLLDRDIRPLGFHNFRTTGCEAGMHWYKVWQEENENE